ncbi:hypothetical protein QNA08_01670 [Chelatococcus sp. SYSU_G07232]|uniref:Uncharacterized protein n=2 Tax=Chelatococcus albus TaxID=3047466 RepID=A0ABT7AC63_9HYPH|nr:hypothetical protein [Chelatococcus sp. SYSU_G07232]
MKRRKIWLGLGAAAMVGGGAASAAALEAGQVSARTPEAALVASAGNKADARLRFAANADHAGHGAVKTAAAAGGEGEGGEGGKKASVAPAVQFNHNLALIRGHLLVGDELVKEGKWNDAMVHFLHPAEEIYGNIQGDLKTYGVAPFAAALKALAQTVKAKNKDAYEGALKAVDQRLTAAEAAVKAKSDDYTRLTVETVLELLGTAGHEYEAAVDGNKIRETVEYQDSRGFVWYAERLLDGISTDLQKKDAEAFKSLKADLAELKQAWPAAVPPKKPAKDVASVLSGISKVELHAGRLM